MRASQISINDLLKKSAEFTSKKLQDQGSNNPMMETIVHDDNNVD
jgi:hypothetical protein